MNPDGTDKRALTKSPLYAESSACYSPDGRTVVFTGIGGSGRPSLYVLDTATGRRRRIAESTGEYYWGSPVFSPDGRRIVANICSAKRGVGGAQKYYEVYVVSLDGSEVQRVGPEYGMCEAPCFVDGGRAVAYAVRPEGAIYVQKPGEKRRQRVLHKPGKSIDEFTVWEPKTAR
jgi:Tol biopolymer transport system component